MILRDAVTNEGAQWAPIGAMGEDAVIRSQKTGIRDQERGSDP